MKTGRNLQEVLVELNRQNKAKQDFISPAQGMRLREDGHTFEINHLTTNQQEVFGTTSLFHRQVASALGIPAKYYDLMQAQKPELLAENVNSWFADKPGSYMVRSMDYGAGQVARALLSERYRRIDNMEIATSVLPLFAGNDQYEVMSCEVTENRLYLKVVNHRLEMEVRRGDIVQAGVIISNSEVGLGAVSIQRWCTVWSAPTAWWSMTWANAVIMWAGRQRQWRTVLHCIPMRQWKRRTRLSS